MAPLLDPLSTQAKLRRLSQLGEDLDAVGDVDEQLLLRERLTLHALERIITQVVETASSIASHVVVSRDSPAPTTYRGSFVELARIGVIDEGLAATLGDAAGMRNLLVHNYARVDLAIVASAVVPLRAATTDFVAQVGAWLSDRP